MQLNSGIQYVNCHVEYISLNAFDFVFMQDISGTSCLSSAFTVFDFPFKYLSVVCFSPTSTVPMNVAPVFFYCAILPPIYSKYILLI